ncbi:MAG: winged helix-turn-helix transcriptional regulator [Candidatus Hodarchaeota archaeon]
MSTSDMEEATLMEQIYSELTELKAPKVLCRLYLLAHVLGKRWTLRIITHLMSAEKLRFGEIKRLIGDISPKVLTERLRGLTAAGIILREVIEATSPIEVNYSLTSKGRDLYDILVSFKGWTEQWINDPCEFSPTLCETCS